MKTDRVKRPTDIVTRIVIGFPFAIFAAALK